MSSSDWKVPNSPATSNLKNRLKEEARRLGFLAVGIAPPSALHSRQSALTHWIQSGYSGHLAYMGHFSERQDRLLSGFTDLKSIIALAISYPGNSQIPLPPRTGRVAQYAQGRDYHRVIEKKLKALEKFLQSQVDSPLRILRCVDTSAIQERALAEAAGLGFFGKNTCLILPRSGSFVFLAALLTNLELAPDEPLTWDCGSCTLCLEACPTGALPKPYELDARRCISYLTIELKGPLDPSLKPLIEEWLFGCDICQQVCPYNRKKDLGKVWPEFHPSAGVGPWLALEELLKVRSEADFLARCGGTPLMRAKREGLLRNAAIVAGNLRDPKLVPPLAEALLEDLSPLIRQHAAWALGQMATQEAIEGLQKASHRERVPSVLEEIQQALKVASPA